MAIWNGQGRGKVVMIEWRPCHLADEQEITQLAAIMYRNKPSEIRVPLCYGMIMPSHQNSARFGLVLELPEYIRWFTEADLTKAVVRFRMPVTLKRMLQNLSAILELGLGSA